MKACLDKYPQAHELKGRHRVIWHSLKQTHKEISEMIPKETLIEYIKDVIYADRLVRKMTEGEDKENKDKEEVELLKELGY